MPAVDYKVTYIRQADDRVDITSTEAGRLTAGIYKLSQKVIHALLTRVGDDELSPSWGCFLVDILKIPYSSDRVTEVYSFVLAAVEKVENDIINLQQQQTNDSFFDETEILDNLELLDVRANVELQQWEVDIRIHSVAGEELQFIL